MRMVLNDPYKYETDWDWLYSVSASAISHPHSWHAKILCAHYNDATLLFEGAKK